MHATAPGVGTLMKAALDLPDVFVTRTFSKAYGMAGMRMGYAIGQPETLRKLSNAWGLGDISELQAVAGIAALADQEHMAWEKQENKRIRDYTTAEFQKMGFQVADSQTNFIFVNIGRPAAGFRDACRELGVAVGRDFPPMEKSWARASRSAAWRTWRRPCRCSGRCSARRRQHGWRGALGAGEPHRQGDTALSPAHPTLA